MRTNVISYMDAFRSGRKMGVEGLCGRIIRGTKPEDFVMLTDDPRRKLVLLMGRDGLELILGKTGFEALQTIGYESGYIVRKVRDERNQFKLVVFEEGGDALLATWENTVKVVSRVYPNLKRKLRKNIGQLKTVPFGEIERMSGFNFGEVDKNGPDDPRYMTAERFERSKGTLANVRAFLYYTVHLRELYSGDGFTYDNDGNRGLMEFIVPNQPIAGLSGCMMIDLDIMLPEA